MSDKLEKVKKVIQALRSGKVMFPTFALVRVGVRWWMVDNLEVVAEWPTWVFSRLGNNTVAVSDSGLEEFTRRAHLAGYVVVLLPGVD